jgi:dTDP-4-amino-4,6-dideoxygalactose transaminase
MDSNRRSDFSGTPPRSTAARIFLVKSTSIPQQAGPQTHSTPQAVPLLDLHRQYEGIRDEVLAAIARVCETQSFVLGPEVEALEGEIAAFTGAKFAVGCASGTEALWLALVAAGVKPGERVVTTPFSFFASASAIVRAGATPLFVDVDPGTLNLDPALVEGALAGAAGRGPQAIGARSGSGNVRAILPVHLYGQCADMDSYQRIASEVAGSKNKIAIVEDAAQAIGAEWDGRGAGSLGVAAAFSFYPTKNLSAYGDAGIVTTSNQHMAEHMRQLRNHGSPRRYYHHEFGWNGRMDAIQGAVLRVKMTRIARWNDMRRQHAATYDKLFTDSGLLGKRGSADASTPVRLLKRSPQAKHVFHQYVIRAQRRDELRHFLAERKIGSEIYYPLPLHLQPVFAFLGLKAGDLPLAEQGAKEVLALPMYPELTDDAIQYVVESIAQFYS